MHVCQYSLRFGAVAFVALALLHGCSQDEPPRAAPAAPVREAFHASKPVRIQVLSAARDAAPNVEWLERELRHLLSQGKMRVAAADATNEFTLRVELPADMKEAALSLLAPDRTVERATTVAIAATHRLDIARALAARLPGFLGAAHSSGDWVALIGTQDVEAYEVFARSEGELLGKDARGYTRPVSSAPITRTIEKLEVLTRKYPQFARAWSLLAIGYLSLGGDDSAALVSLAETSAERALALDDGLALAYAADGLVRLRRMDWTSAQQQFERTLKIDANIVPALEGLACLRADVGQPSAVLQVAARALASQPGNLGASECQAYALAATATPLSQETPSRSSAARMQAVVAILSNDAGAAQKILRGSPDAGADWVAPVVRASRTRRSIADALQALTLAADEGRIDAATEIQFGAALRQADFVFNRMRRLTRQGQSVPLRVLWLPQASFLRQHERFEPLVSSLGLPAYWQQHGPPEICKSEPTTFGCKR
jgi:hypothetical protein